MKHAAATQLHQSCAALVESRSPLLPALPADADSHAVLPNGTAEQLDREETPIRSRTSSLPEEDSPAGKQGLLRNGDVDDDQEAVFSTPPSSSKPSSRANSAERADAGTTVESIYLDSHSSSPNGTKGDDSLSSPDAGGHSSKQPLDGGSVLDAAGQRQQHPLIADSEPRISSDAAGKSRTEAGSEESAAMYESPEPNGRADTLAAESGSSGAARTSWGTPGEEPQAPSSGSSSAMKKPKTGLRNVQRSAKKGYMIHRYRNLIIDNCLQVHERCTTFSASRSDTSQLATRVA